MLLPKRVKYRRVHRGRLKGKATRGNTVTYGDFGLQALEPAWITSNQIEAARVAMTRYTKRGGKVWIKIFPDKPITEKPAETRMGSGKGSPEYWVAVVKPGRVMFEIAGVSEEVAREALRTTPRTLDTSKPYQERRERRPRRDGDRRGGFGGDRRNGGFNRDRQGGFNRQGGAERRPQGGFRPNTNRPAAPAAPAKEGGAN